MGARDVGSVPPGGNQEVGGASPARWPPPPPLPNRGTAAGKEFAVVASRRSSVPTDGASPVEKNAGNVDGAGGIRLEETSGQFRAKVSRTGGRSVSPNPEGAERTTRIAASAINPRSHVEAPEIGKGGLVKEARKKKLNSAGGFMSAIREWKKASDRDKLRKHNLRNGPDDRLKPLELAKRNVIRAEVRIDTARVNHTKAKAAYDQISSTMRGMDRDSSEFKTAQSQLQQCLQGMMGSRAILAQENRNIIGARQMLAEARRESGSFLDHFNPELTAMNFSNAYAADHYEQMALEDCNLLSEKSISQLMGDSTMPDWFHAFLDKNYPDIDPAPSVERSQQGGEGPVIELESLPEEAVAITLEEVATPEEIQRNELMQTVSMQEERLAGLEAERSQLQGTLDQEKMADDSDELPRIHSRLASIEQEITEVTAGRDDGRRELDELSAPKPPPLPPITDGEREDFEVGLAAMNEKVSELVGELDGVLTGVGSSDDAPVKSRTALQTELRDTLAEIAETRERLGASYQPALPGAADVVEQRRQANFEAIQKLTAGDEELSDEDRDLLEVRQQLLASDDVTLAALQVEEGVSPLAETATRRPPPALPAEATSSTRPAPSLGAESASPNRPAPSPGETATTLSEAIAAEMADISAEPSDEQLHALYELQMKRAELIQNGKALDGLKEKGEEALRQELEVIKERLPISAQAAEKVQKYVGNKPGENPTPYDIWLNDLNQQDQIVIQIIRRELGEAGPFIY